MSPRRDHIFNLIQRFNVAADHAIANSSNESNVPLVERYVALASFRTCGYWLIASS